MLKKSVVILFWLCTTAWLVRFEAFPELFTDSLTGYEHVLSRNLLMTDSWLKIFINNPVFYGLFDLIISGQ